MRMAYLRSCGGWRYIHPSVRQSSVLPSSLSSVVSYWRSCGGWRDLRQLSRYSAPVVVGHLRPLSRYSAPVVAGVTYVRPSVRQSSVSSSSPSVVALWRSYGGWRNVFVAVVRVYSIAHIQSFAPHASYVCTAARVRCVHR
jgi:hypothetical protein